MTLKSRGSKSIFFATLMTLSLNSVGFTEQSNLDTILKSSNQSYQIVATVNDHPITNFDLMNRLHFVLYSSQMPRTNDALKRLAPQVLQGLVDETIRLQEAKKHGIVITKQQVDLIKTQLEQNNGLSAGGLKKNLLEQNIHYRTVLDQIKASVAWRNFVTEQIAPRLKIDSREVDQRLAAIKKHLDKPRYRLSEIKLTASTPAQRAEIQSFSRQLVGEIKKATAGPQRVKAFKALSDQFSSTQNDDENSWLHEGALKEEHRATLHSMNVGDVSQPIRIREDEYHILFLADKRMPTEAPKMVESIELHQAFIPYPPKASVGDKKSCHDRLLTLKSTIQNEHDLATVNQRLGGERPCQLGLISLTQLPNNMKKAIEGLKIRTLSMPVEVEGGLALLMITKRENARDDIPSHLELMHQIRAEKMEAEERKYFRNLKRGATVSASF